MELVKGQIVYSRKGRDVTRAYVVKETQPDRVLLCDGEKRTLAAPKTKNIRHIMPTGTVLPAEETDTDLKIKMALKPYQKRGQEQKGG
ncbi:KOW domain-containing RNA-binding protein [Ruminococcaceae bacterium OttesenSCG-928-O06]|nr:KOW domain-containing RNA-binding protein [Ruminococcaceae bacterium OttesenSCG-928-O06]